MHESSPVNAGDCVGKVTTLSIIVMAGGLALTLVGGRASHTCGATRSMRLAFEVRKQNIEDAVKAKAFSCPVPGVGGVGDASPPAAPRE